MKNILTTLILLAGLTTSAQVKIGDNPTTLNSSTVLELESSDKAFLAPRMTTADKEAIATPVDGMVVYDTDKACYSLYANGDWTCLGADLSTQPGSILTLDCANAIKNGQLYSNQTATGVSFIIGYTGSNGGFYDTQSFASTGVTGLTANVIGSSFNKTSGAVTFYVSGTPATAGTASFDISLGGQSCTVALTVLPSAGLATLTCGSAAVTGSTIIKNTAISGQTITIPYTSGNGGPYNSAIFKNSVGGGEITALLNAGNFAVGSGTLTFTLSGTPATGGASTITLTAGGSSCTVNLTVSNLSNCTATVAPTSSHTPATYVPSSNATLASGGQVATFTATGGTYTNLSWTLTSSPATGVLQAGTTTGTGATAAVKVVAGARGRVFITWSASTTGACITTTASSTDVIVIGDAIEYSMQTAGCASCNTYDAASVNNWVQVTATEYAALMTNVSGAAKGGMPDVQMAGKGVASSSAGYSWSNYLTSPSTAMVNNGYLLGFSAVYGSVTAGNVKRAKMAVGGTNTNTNVGGTLPVATSVGGTTQLYWILKRPSSTYAGNKLGTYADDTIRALTNNGLSQLGTNSIGDVLNITGQNNNLRLYQGIATATKQW